MASLAIYANHFTNPNEASPNVAACIAVATVSDRAAAGYLPEGELASRVLAHTKLLGPGEEDTITFTPTAASVYKYVCTFPGYTAAGMRGKIVVQ